LKKVTAGGTNKEKPKKETGFQARKTENMLEKKKAHTVTRKRVRGGKKKNRTGGRMGGPRWKGEGCTPEMVTIGKGEKRAEHSRRWSVDRGAEQCQRKGMPE